MRGRELGVTRSWGPQCGRRRRSRPLYTINDRLFLAAARQQALTESVNTQGRELGYQILGLAVRLAPSEPPGGAGAWLATLTGCLPDLHPQHLRLMERHVVIPMLQTVLAGAR